MKQFKTLDGFYKKYSTDTFVRKFGTEMGHRIWFIDAKTDVRGNNCHRVICWMSVILWLKYFTVLCSVLYVFIYWQAGSGQSVWLEEMADWGSGIKNWTALLPLLVSQIMCWPCSSLSEVPSWSHWWPVFLLCLCRVQTLWTMSPKITKLSNVQPV